MPIYDLCNNLKDKTENTFFDIGRFSRITHNDHFYFISMYYYYFNKLGPENDTATFEACFV